MSEVKQEINKDKLFIAIEQISAQNPLTKEKAKKLISDAVIGGFHNKYDPDAELELIIDEDKRIFQLFNNSKLVVKDEEFEDKIENIAIELPLSKAKKIDPNIKAGDLIREEIDFSLYSKTVMSQIRQILTQSIREHTKETVYETHKDLKGTMINVIVSSITPTFVNFQLEDKTAAFMPPNLRNPRIPLSVGQNIKVYVEDVIKESKDAQIIVSNGSKELIKRVLEDEVPEISSGIVEIIAIARKPGVRSKVAVKSNNDNIDAVGTIIGNGGNRIKAIISKLDGEKVDIIPYSDKINIFIANSLLPARVASVSEKFDNDDKLIENEKIVIVPNIQLTLAIGKLGINAKLAVELTGMKIDVMSIKQAQEQEIDIVYNAGLTEQEINDIESGIKINKRAFSTKGSSFDSVRIDNSEFDDTTESFKNSITNISDENEWDDSPTKIDIDDKLFTDENLKAMEDAFENDYDQKNNESDDDSNEDFEF